MRTVLFLLMGAALHGQEADLTVASDGSARFRTVQAAINAVRPENTERVVILIRNGVYREKLEIHNSYLTLRGEDRRKTRIEWDEDTSACALPGSVEENCAVVHAMGNDLVFERLTIESTLKTKEGKTTALSVVGGSTRTVVKDADILGVGGDTLTLASRGQYYLSDVRVTGTYHIIVPRGNAYFTRAEFGCLGNRICLFAEGTSRETDKLVIRDSKFDGPAPFGLGSYFRDAAWYFVGNTFSEKLMKDGAIFRQPKPNYVMKWGEGRIYFAGNRGPEYAWLKDNIEQSPAKTKEAVTAAWALVDWDPENATPLEGAVQSTPEAIRVTFPEPVTVKGKPYFQLAAGKRAAYLCGSGTSTLVFQAGTGAAMGNLKVDGGAIVASRAAATVRRVH